MNQIYLLLGANLGTPVLQLLHARQHIETSIGKITKASHLYETEAWGLVDQPTFVNQVILVETALSATETLEKTQYIENQLGRIRAEKWGARLIDIDILYYNAEIIKDDNLLVPHPLLQERNFVLIPLNEIAPQFVHPILGITNESLLHKSSDTAIVNILNH